MSSQYQSLAIDDHPPILHPDWGTNPPQIHTPFPRPFSTSTPLIDERSPPVEPNCDPYYSPPGYDPFSHPSQMSSALAVDGNPPSVKPDPDIYPPPSYDPFSPFFSTSPALEMLVFFMIGCATATAHHFYYRHLNGKPVDSTRTPFHDFDNQKWASHLGTALAFATKFFFAKAIGAAYVQRLWTAVRRTGGVSLDGLDAGFDILNNPMGFLCWDLISSAQRLILLGLVSWAMPLIAIIAPGALLVVSQDNSTQILSCAVPSVDLSTPDSSAALSLYTNSSTGESYLASPSPQMQQLATLALLSGTYTVPPSPCGPTNVCIYTTTFFAPYFNCSTEPYDIEPRTHDNGTYFWNATSAVNLPNDTPDQLYIEWYGDRQANITSALPSDQAQRIICSAVNATYTFHIQHNGPDPRVVTSQSVTFVKNFSTVYDSTNSIPQDNSSATVYAAIFQAVTGILNGTVLNGSKSDPVGEAVPLLLLSRQSQYTSPQDGSAHYVNPISLFFSLKTNQTMVTMGNFGYMNETIREWIPFSDIGDRVESLMYNISIGLAALNISGSSNHSPNQTCTHITKENIYFYRPMVLCVPYAVAFICTLFSILVGMHALWSNQSTGTTGFKTTLAATRNPELDVVVSGRMGKNGKRVRLRFVDFGADRKPRKVFEVEPNSMAGPAI